jgi:hypothetical protein
VPPEFSSTLHVTAVLVVPVALAVKACVASRNTVTELGVTVTLTSEAGELSEDEEVEPPPHPQNPNAAAIVSAVAMR